jgi:hypothetical protein
VEVANNVDAKHWKRLRDAFLHCITERDFIGCLIVQEIMLESFADLVLLVIGVNVRRWRPVYKRVQKRLKIRGPAVPCCRDQWYRRPREIMVHYAIQIQALFLHADPMPARRRFIS